MIGGFERICNRIDEEFSRNRRLHGERIGCRRGCSDCCHQLFQITEIEAAVISKAVRGLPGEEFERLRARSAAYLEARTELAASKGVTEAWGSLPPPGSRLACPALREDGGCGIYEARPLICRKFGIPLWNPDRPGRVHACELNFRPGEAIEDPDLIQIQTGLHEEVKAMQAEWNRRGLPRVAEPLTVARAVVEDFSGWLGLC